MLIVVSYDVKDNKRRNKLSALLKNYGVRVQYSVFECELDQNQLVRMSVAAKKLLNIEEDSLLIYTLCGRCSTKRAAIGIGVGELPGPVLVI